MKKITLFTLLLFSILTSIVVCNSRCATLGSNLNLRKVFPRKSFLFVRKTSTFFQCAKIQCKIVHKGTMTGSASVIHHRGNKTFLLTAAHMIWMEPINFMQRMLLEANGPLKIVSSYVFTDIRGKKFKLQKIIKSDKATDLAVVQIARTDIPALLLSEHAPRVKDKLYNIAAPTGMFEKGLVLFFEGRYMGISSKSGISSLPVALTNIPVAGGSSGSPILNSCGEVVGMVSAVSRRFHHISISPTYKQLYNFLHKHLKPYQFSMCHPDSGIRAAREAFLNSQKGRSIIDGR